MAEILERTAVPYNAVCYIEATFPGGLTLRGSGVIVGPNDVLTALHLVYQARFGGWASSVTVIPAFDTSPYDAPFDAFREPHPTFAGRAANWDLNGDGLITEDEAQGDMAVIGLGQRIGEAAGWMSITTHAADSAGLVAGYPIAGTGLMAEPVYADASAGYGVYAARSTMTAGASGGPLFISSGGEFFVAGVLSSGDVQGNTTYAALFGAGTRAWLAAATAANDDLIGGTAKTFVTGTDAPDVLSGDAQADIFAAGAGDDWLVGGSGNDTIDGEAGLDTAVFNGPAASYLIDFRDGAIAVTDGQARRDGTDELFGIERLRFTDRGLAFDMDGHAGLVARIMGAVFGAGSLAARPDYVGIGLRHADLGADAATLAQLALDTCLGAGASNVAVVNLLYANVTGSAPLAAVQEHYVLLLEQNQLSQAELVVYAALTGENAAQVGLMGLATQGLAYDSQA